MAKFATEAIRTIALVGHGASGKTTLAEALLASAGAIASPGSVARGTTVCDRAPFEQQHAAAHPRERGRDGEPDHPAPDDDHVRVARQLR